ncbi:MAG: hypothetical protein ACREQL_11140 [Candidatus Binatia bacterium]
MLFCMAADSQASNGFDALQTLLTTAHQLASALVGDPLLPRILRAFQLLPECDREPILKILEKEAAWRRIVEDTAPATGIRVCPNPHASLYVHVLDQVTGDPIDPEAFSRDGDVIRVGIENFLRPLPFLFQEGVYAQWTAAAREVTRAATAEVRRSAARLAHEVIALVAEADPESAAAS